MQGVGGALLGLRSPQPFHRQFLEDVQNISALRAFWSRDLRRMAAKKPRCEAQKVSGGGAVLWGSHSHAAVCHERCAKVLEKFWRCVEC